MTNIPHNNDKNTRIRRGMNTIREMNAGRIPVDNVCRCSDRVPENGVRDSSNRRLMRNSNAISDEELRTNNSLIARIPGGGTRTRIATVSLSTGQASAAGTVSNQFCANPISTQMKWTFPSPHAACPCVAGLVINMDYDTLTGQWRGTATGCLGSIYCIMADQDAGLPSVGISGTSYAVAYANREVLGSATCTPFSVTGNITSDQLTVCGVVSPNAIPVNITER